jgi:hypothetical protein
MRVVGSLVLDMAFKFVVNYLRDKRDRIQMED